MSRWHGQLCCLPDIIISPDSQLPTCRTCGHACPSIAELITQQATIESSWTLPTDEPRDHMNLSWPSSVPYVRETEQPELASSSPTAATSESNARHSWIYGDTLKTTQIRLACLSAVPNEGYPVHVNLETYDDDDCPEYECTSYSWGGEEGDSTLCKPVFIGEYWDVVLQTQNCWSMLRFLRPWRGFRLVWVDAVCINQENSEEKGFQIAKMRQIYQDCTRVVVYLGEDIVTPSASFPLSRSLDALENGSLSGSIFPERHELQHEQYGLAKLLSRRYFNRVWVIQELVLSERAVLRVGKIILRADATIVKRLSQKALGGSSELDEATTSIQSTQGHGLPHEDNLNASLNKVTTSSYKSVSSAKPSRENLDDSESDESLVSDQDDVTSIKRGNFPWHQTAAPWVRFMAHGAFPLSKVKDVASLLRLTAHSSASDPRDRLFGVLSVSPNSNVLSDLKPEYSLSFQHFSIGLFAYFLLKERRYWFLWRPSFSGDLQCDPSSYMPSWMPECRSETSWREVLLAAPASPPPPYVSISTYPFSLFLDQSCTKFASWDRSAKFDVTMPKDAVDSATGALLITVTHLFAFQTPLVQEKEQGSLVLYAVPRHTRKGTLVVSNLQVVSLGPLEIQPGRDHLFIPASMPGVYLILRQCSNEGEMPAYRFVTSSIRIFQKGRLRQRDIRQLQHSQSHNLETWSQIRAISNSDGRLDVIQMSVAWEIEEIRQSIRKLTSLSDADLEQTTDTLFRWDFHSPNQRPQFRYFFLWSICPPKRLKAEDEDDILRSILRLCLAIHADDDHLKKAMEKEHLENVYLSSINPKLLNKKVGTESMNSIEFIVDYADWRRRGYEKDFFEQDCIPSETADSWEQPYLQRAASSFNKSKSALTLSSESYWWAWKREGEKNWQRAGKLLQITERRKSFVQSLMDLSWHSDDGKVLENIIIRASLPHFIQRLRTALHDTQKSLRRIVEVYDPPPDLETLLQMVKNGATNEHRLKGTVKYMAGVKIDGSVQQVKIV